MSSKHIAQDFLQEKLEDNIRKVFLPLKKEGTEFLLLHYITGTEDNPYILRRTAIRTTDKVPNKKHREALSRFIRYFSRQNTFLDLIINMYINIEKEKRKKNNRYEKFKNSFQGKVIIDRMMNKFFDEIKDEYYIEWRFNEEVKNIIMPEVINSEDFFKKLISNNSTWKSYNKKPWTKLFNLNLYKLFAKLVEENTVKRTYLSISRQHEYINSINYIYKLSAGFQSGLLYFLIYLKKQSFSFHIFSDYDANEKYLRMIVALISPAKNDFNGNTGISEKIYPIFNDMKTIGPTVLNTHEYISEEIKPYIDDHVFEQFKEVINKDVFRTQRFKNDKTYITFLKWLLLIAIKMKGSIHEGKKLEFYFLLGDKSEFQDAEYIKFRSFNGEQINFNLNIPDISVPNDGYNEKIVFSKEIQKRILLLTKEHYAWFEDGRNALLWDLESNILKGCTYPVGLVSILNYSWRQILRDMLKRNDLPFNIPNCILYAVDNEQNTLSVFKIVKNDTSKELLRFQGSKWTLRDIDKRIKALEKILNIIFKEKNRIKNKIERIAKIAVKIGEDPHKGGTIVFRNKIDNVIGVIGQTLKLEDANDYEEEDLISLISQDGATFYDIDSNKFEFRKILTFHEIDESILNNLFEKYLENINESFKTTNKQYTDLWPLAFVGSRRWSSAITILQENVNGVLVISQDGDIFLWYRTNNKINSSPRPTEILNSIRAIELKTNGDVSCFSMKDNKIQEYGNVFEDEEVLKKLGGQIC